MPTPHAVPRLRRPRLEKVLRAHRIRRFDAAAVLAALGTPPLPVAPGTVEAASAHVALLLPRLRLVSEQRLSCGRQIDALLARLGESSVPPGPSGAPSDVRILRSLVGVDSRVSATMFAEAAQLLAPGTIPPCVPHAGIAPVTWQSGKRKQVVMRHACHGRLRGAVYHWAFISMQHDDHSAAI